MIVFFVGFFLAILVAPHRAAAVPIVDPGGGGASTDNRVLNGSFEYGTTSWRGSGIGTPKVVTTRHVDGDHSLRISGVVTLGTAIYQMSQDVTDPEPITKNTRLCASIILEHDYTIAAATVILVVSVSPNHSFVLAYYVSDNLDFPDLNFLGIEQYVIEVGNKQGAWKSFCRNISDDIQTKTGYDPADLSIKRVILDVRSSSVGLGASCTGYFDDLYLGSTPPGIWVNNPDDEQWVSGTYTFSGTAVDHRGRGLAFVAARITTPGHLIPDFMGLCDGTTEWSLEYDTTHLSEGRHEFRVDVFDNANTWAHASVFFRVDNTNPSGTISNLETDHYYRGVVTVTGSASDALSGVDRVRVRIDNGEWEAATGTTSWSYEWDTTTVSDGSHTFTARVYDRAGNYVDRSVRVNIDNSAPSLGTVTFGPSYGSLNQEFTISISSITETGSGVKKVEATVKRPDGSTFTVKISKKSDGSWEGSFPLGSSDAEGTYTLVSIYAIDKIGNEVTNAYSKKIVYDYTAPTLTFTSHDNYDQISGTVTLSGSLSDAVSGLYAATITIDGSETYDIVSSSGTWSFSLDTTAYDDGYHVFRLQARDRAGNVRIITYYLAIANSPEPVAPFIPVVNENGDYLTTAYVTVGSSQVTILCTFPDGPPGTMAYLLVAPPFDSLWSLQDVAIVVDDGSPEGSTKSILSVCEWSTDTHSLSFPLSADGGVGRRSVIAFLSKAQLSWSVSSPSKVVYQGQEFTVSFTLENYDSLSEAYGGEFRAELIAYQDGQGVVLGTAECDSSGVFTFVTTIGPGILRGGPLTLQARLIDVPSSVYDTTDLTSPLFDGFVFYELIGWEFSPDTDTIVHYSPTVYDQRQVTVEVRIVDSAGIATTMVGQVVEVTVTGPGVSDSLLIYQTEHDDGTYALFSYSLTTAGQYIINFTYVPTGYYYGVVSRTITVQLYQQRPVETALDVPESLQVGTTVTLRARVVDVWAGGYPVAGVQVTFQYQSSGVWTDIGTASTDGDGLATLTWSPAADEWARIAGQDIIIRTISQSSAVYQASEVQQTVAVGLVGTYFVTPVATPAQILTGEQICIEPRLFDQFGNILEHNLTVEIVGPYGYVQRFEMTAGPDSSLNLTLDLWGNYTVEVTYAGDSVYGGNSVTESIRVIGLLTFPVVTVTPDPASIVAGEPFNVQFDLTDINGEAILGATLRVSVTWEGITSGYVIVTGVNSTITLSYETRGIAQVLCQFDGDATYEPSEQSIAVSVQRRPVSIDLTVPMDTVYPYVGPSLVSYSLSATVVDALTGQPLDNVSVVFCYVTENSTVLLPVSNSTGDFNVTLASEYLAWGLFNSIGTSYTGSTGGASAEWQVPSMNEQTLYIFAVTEQSDRYLTGVSTVYPVEFVRIPTTVAAEAEWTGVGKEVNVSLSLEDVFALPLYDKEVHFTISSILDSKVVAEGTAITGFNSSFSIQVPEYGAYTITVWFEGDEYYQPSGEYSAVFVVSWRNVGISLAAPDWAYPGEEIQLSAHVTDLNATPESHLLEPVTVYFAWKDEAGFHAIGSALTDEAGTAVLEWASQLVPGRYQLVAYTHRQTIYDVGLSQFHAFEIRPIRTHLSVSVNRTVTWSFNYTYDFSVSLTDQFGNNLTGEVVTLRLTDNYTDLWSFLHFDEDAIWEFEDGSCYGNPLYHLFELRVVIGYNDTFTWVVPGCIADRILFAPRAIAIAEYSGNVTYLPSVYTTKMDNCLLNTRTDVLLGNTTLMPGVPVTLTVNVTDEDGCIVSNGVVTIVIEDDFGQSENWTIDLGANNSIVWTPWSFGRFTIHAEYTGGRFYELDWHCGCHHHPLRGILRRMRLTRSYNITTVAVEGRPTLLTMEELPTRLTAGEGILLRASAVDALTGSPIPGLEVRFYYLTSDGDFILVGSNRTNEAGQAIYVLDPPAPSKGQGYESVFIFAQGLSSRTSVMSSVPQYPTEIWPPSEQFQSLSQSAASPAQHDRGTARSQIDIIALPILISAMAVPLQLLRSRNRRLFKLLMIAVVLFSVVFTLYGVLGLESMNHPFRAALIEDVRTNFESVSTPTGRPYAPDSDPVMTGSLSFGTIRTADSGTIPSSLAGYAVASPNASYIVVPLRKRLWVNFTAHGHYVITVVDGDRQPIDTVAGFADGNTTVDFTISSDKYDPGSTYAVNIFVTVQSGGITYGDTSWIVMYVSKTATHLDLTPEYDSLYYSATARTMTLAARLTRVLENATIANKVVSFRYRSATDLNWTDIGTSVTDERGIATIEWSLSLTPGSYVVNATFAGDSTHFGSTSAKVVEVKGVATVLNFVEGAPLRTSVQYGHAATFYARLTDSLHVPLQNRTVEFYVVTGDRSYLLGANRTGPDGLVEFTYAPYFIAGLYDILAVFPGDANHAPSRLTFSGGLQVLPRICVFSSELAVSAVAGDTVIISVPVTDDRGVPVSGSHARFEVYNPESGTWDVIGETDTDQGGYATIEYTVNVTPGAYVIRLVIEGDATLDGGVLQGTLTVGARPTTVRLVSVEGDYGQAVTLTAHLQDSDGLALPDSTLLFYVRIDDTWRFIGSALTTSDGWAELSWVIDLPAGQYDVRVVFPGDSLHASSQSVGPMMTVETVPAVLALSVPTEAFITLPMSVNVSLHDALGAPLGQRVVTLSIAPSTGVATTVTLQTDENGTASFVYVPPYLGEYSVTATFAGDSFYDDSTASGQFVAKKIEVSISLVLSKTSGHRGDRILFSGMATIRPDGETVPAYRGIPFDMVLVGNEDFPVGSYSIRTEDGGVITGWWEIPRYLSDNISRLFDAGDYTFRVSAAPGTAFTGETTFEFRIILRTTLTVEPVYPTVNGATLSSPYVDIPMGFTFSLVDEDNRPMQDYLLYTDIDGSGWSEVSTDKSGQWSANGFVPDTARGIYARAKFEGTPYFDPACDGVALQVLRRDMRLSMTLGNTYVHRGDELVITVSATDLLTGNPITGEPVEFVVYVDGEKMATTSVSATPSLLGIVLPSWVKAGNHSVTVRADVSRVYLSDETEQVISAYEHTRLDLTVPSEANTEDQVRVLVSLEDEDGLPVRDRFVTVSITKPDGSMLLRILRTDALGHGSTVLTPMRGGVYSLSAEFGGEFHYVQSSVEPTGMIVEALEAQSEAGPSPLWMLPIILMIIVNCFLEAATLGMVSFLDVSVPMGGGTLRLFKYSYPWIEIQWAKVRVGLVDVDVPVPVLVLKSEASYEWQSDDKSVTVSSKDGDATAMLFGNANLMEVVDDAWLKFQPDFSVPQESTPSPGRPGTDTRSTSASAMCETVDTMPSSILYDSPHTGVPFAETPVLPEPRGTASSHSGFTVEILTPAIGQRVEAGVPVTALVDGLNASQIDSVNLYVDDEQVDTMSPYIETSNATWFKGFWYSQELDGVTPKWSNGPHMLKVEVRTKSGETSEAKVPVNVFNLSTIGLGFIIMLATEVLITVLVALLGPLIEKAIEFIAKSNPTAGGILEAIASTLLFVLTYYMTIFLVDMLQGLVGYGFLTTKILGTSFMSGHLIGLIVFILGMILGMTVSGFKTKNYRTADRLALFVTGLTLKVYFKFLERHLPDILAGFGPAADFVEFEISVLESGLEELVIGILLALMYKKYVSKQMRNTMLYQSGAMGICIAGIEIIFITEREAEILYEE